MGSEVSGGARASGVSDAKDCTTGRSLVFAVPKTERISPTVSQRGSEYNANSVESSSCIKKADTESCRNTLQLSSSPKEDMLHELYGGSISNSQALAAGHASEGKQLQRKERRVPRTSPGCFKTPRTPQMETSISTAENVDMRDACDELIPHTVKSPHSEKSQPLKQKNNVNGKRGDRRSSKVLLKTKHDGLAGFSPAFGGSKAFGTYGLKPDVHDITKLIDDISFDELLHESYKCPTVGKERGKKPANTSENILQSVRKSVSILQHRGLSLVNKQCDEIDIALSKEISLAQTSNLSMSSNLDVDEESSLASDLSCPKVQESCVSTEAPPDTGDVPLYHPRDIIEKLALNPPKDLDSLLDAAKLTFPRCNDPRLGKPLSGRVTLPSFSWSHNHNGHSKSNSDSVKVSSRSSCQGRWARVKNTSSFFGGGTQSFADLDSFTYDPSLVPSGSVKYILPQTEQTASEVSSSIVSEQATSSVICSTSSPSPPALHSPRAMTAAQALFDIANSIVNPTANGIIKWPKLPSQKAMKARKLKSIQSSENLLAPKSEVMLDSTVRFLNHMTPLLKKPKLLISEKREHSGHVNSPKAPYIPSAPRSSRSSPTRASRETAPDACRNHANGTVPKPLFKPPPRRVTEKTNHSHQKLRKVLQMDWNRGKNQL